MFLFAKLALLASAAERAPMNDSDESQPAGAAMRIEKGGRDIRTVDDWFEIAPPKGGHEHWVDGRSALECARAWCGPEGPAVPTELTDLLASHPDTTGALIRSVVPEHLVRFDSFPGEPRNADIAALADHPGGLIAINVEAKADEPFDQRVHEVLTTVIQRIAADEHTNGIARIQQLAVSLLPPRSADTSQLGDLRYQLLTGLAGAIAFAIASKATKAVFVIHEFITERTDDAKHEANARDFVAFLARLTAGEIRSIVAGRLVGPITIPGRPLFESAPPLYLGKSVRNLRDGSSHYRRHPTAFGRS
jgi:hypothetical protein